MVYYYYYYYYYYDDDDGGGGGGGGGGDGDGDGDDDDDDDDVYLRTKKGTFLSNASPPYSTNLGPLHPQFTDAQIRRHPKPLNS